jgi:hypothetical protein
VDVYGVGVKAPSGFVCGGLPGEQSDVTHSPHVAADGRDGSLGSASSDGRDDLRSELPVELSKYRAVRTDRVMQPLDPRDGAVLHAELVLCHRGASLADVYRASAAFSVPQLGRSSGADGETGRHRFGGAIAAERTSSSTAAALLQREMLFHDIVVELGGNETLEALQAVLHGLVDDALHRLASLVSQATVVGVVDGPTHQKVFRLVEAGRGRDAQLLVHRRALQGDDLLRVDRLTGAPLRDLLL